MSINFFSLLVDTFACFQNYLKLRLTIHHVLRSIQNQDTKKYIVVLCSMCICVHIQYNGSLLSWYI